MGSRNRTSKFERDDRNHRGSSYYYKDNGSEDASSSRSKMPLLQFTTDIDPACFSGPISLPLSESRSPFPTANYRNMDSYGSSESQDRKFSSRRDSGYGYSEEEERRSRRYRDRDYDRDYDRGRDRSRERDRGRERIRDRSYERDDDRRDRDRMNDRMRDRDRDWREEIPNNTIMVRGLDTSVNETEIRDEVMRYGLEPKDIRLIREKGTGASRGFAFVEFQLLSEAVRWKELTKGSVVFHGQNRSSLHYSIPKDLLGAERLLLNKADWDCPKCGMSNFKRRDFCFKCNSARDEPYEFQQGGECYSEVSNTPSNTLLFGNLDVLTTEGRVLAMLGQLTTLPIKSLRVAKDSLTNTSRGFAFVELNSTSEAIQLYELLLSMAGNFLVDGRQVTVSYAKRSLAARNSTGSANAAIVALAAAQWTNQKQEDSGYDQYYGKEPSQAHTSESSLTQQTQVGNLGTVLVNGITYYKYPLPDISTYQYEESSGFYYDSITGLYYDANSQYYYNSETQQYLFWDGENQTYLPVPATASTPAKEAISQSTISSPPVSAPPQTPTVVATENEEDKTKSKKEEKLDKVKIAKKIAKDMEKWAKTLNQKKENAKLGIVASPPPMMMPNISISNDFLKHSATADAGFAILEKRTSVAERNALLSMAEMDTKITAKTMLVSYGDDSDSDTEPDSSQPDVKKNVQGDRVDESKYIDLNKMACLLCKRQFPSKEALKKHQQLSDLHKKNLAKIGNT